MLKNYTWISKDRSEWARDLSGGESCDYSESWCETDLTKTEPCQQGLVLLTQAASQTFQLHWTFWTSSGTCFLLSSPPGLSSDRAQDAQWAESKPREGSRILAQGAHLTSPHPSRRPLEDSRTDMVSEQVDIHQARRMLFLPPLEAKADRDCSNQKCHTENLQLTLSSHTWLLKPRKQTKSPTHSLLLSGINCSLGSNLVAENVN
jgi:hypothetical protein